MLWYFLGLAGVSLICAAWNEFKKEAASFRHRGSWDDDPESWKK